MADEQTFIIQFQNQSVAEAGQKANALRDFLLDLSPDVQAEVVKDNQSTQDFGATLVLVLGAPAVVIIAKGLADYLRRDSTNTEIIIYDGKREVLATNLTSKDAARIAEAFSQKK